MAGAAPSTPQQAAKRRRLETVSQTLARPFRSPFKPTAASTLNHQPSPSIPSPSPMSYDKTVVTASTTTTAANATPKQGTAGGPGGLGVLLPTPPRSLPPPLPSSASRQPLFSSPAAGARTSAWPGAGNRAPPGLPVPGRPAGATASGGAASLFSPSLAGTAGTAAAAAATTAQLSAADPAVKSLLRTQRTLEREVAAVRSEVDTLRQAYKIEATGADDELLALIQKWRLASRAVAEVVYVDVRDRVNRMGGVSAWKNMQRRRDEWRSEDDDTRRGGFGDVALSGDGARGGRRGRQQYDDDDEDSERKGNNDEDDDKYADYDVYDDDDSGSGARAAARDDNNNNDDDDDNEFFTMDMMLKSLGIELDVIGFDKRLQRWVD